MSPKRKSENNQIEILVVEDSPTQAEQLKYILEKEGYHISVAHNGTEALSLLNKHKPGIVISDIVMPEMDGYQLCRQMKAHENFKGIPVILLTALSDPKDVVKALECGADNFLTKPYEERYLLSRLKYFLINQEIRRTESIHMGLEIFFQGQRFLINSDRMQILNLLLSTYEAAVQKNNELIEAQDDLRALNEQLEEKVEQRTVALTAEITERKKAEEALQLTHFSVEHASESVFWIDSEGHLDYINEAACRSLGYSREELLSMSIWDIDPDFNKEKWTTHWQELPKRGPSTRESHHRTKEGKIFPIEITGDYLRYGEKEYNIAFVRDITERKRAEEEKIALQEQLRQSQKMEAIGQLAGGIAHDFNNLLTVIKGYSQLSQMELKEGDPLKENLGEIGKAAERAANLTRQILAFSRRQVMEMRVLDLNTVLRDLDKMLRRVIGEDVELVTLLASDVGRVKTDPGQIEQVIMNLAINARDAMPHGGKLTLETANVELDEHYARNHIAVKPGRYVMLSVSDTGVGMTPEVRDRVFEPFFTTKEKSKGTGLGLSTVYGIVKQSGGNIWVYSEPNHGTTFKIYLPRVDEPLEEIKEEVVGEEIHRGGETILLVEDEEEVRKLAVRILERQGYTVLEACDGEEALFLCKERKGPIHLILTDVVMPQMGGPGLVGQLKQVRQDFKVLYMSGYTDNSITHQGVLEKGMNYIQKPFTIDGLIRKVRGVLDK